MKKAISLLAVILVLFTCTVPALAADGEAAPEKGTLFDYRFKIFSKEEIRALADEIALTSYYEPLFLDSGTESVIVTVDLRAHPELSNISVLIESVKAIVDRTPEFVTNTAERIELLDYTRFAGELALHVAALMMIDRFADTGLIENLDELYLTFETADINIDEERISPEFMNFIGFIIMDVLDIVF